MQTYNNLPSGFCKGVIGYLSLRSIQTQAHQPILSGIAPEKSWPIPTKPPKM